MSMIHSIFIADSLQKIPTQTKINLASLRSAHPGMAHGLYTRETLRDFISAHFDRDIVRAYEMGSIAGKADLGRYCLLFELGGVYSDLSLFFFGSVISTPVDKLQIFQNASFGEFWGVSSSLIAAPPKMRLFETCINTFVDRAHQNDGIGDEPARTRSRLFGDALAHELTRSIQLTDIAWGEEITLPGRNGANRCAYKAPAGNFIAIDQHCGRSACAMTPDQREPLSHSGLPDAGLGDDDRPASDVVTREEEDLLALLSIIDANI